MTGPENISIATLVQRVDSLDSDVKTLRREFEDYRKKSEKADDTMSWAMTSLTGKLDKHVSVENEQYSEQRRMAEEHDRKISDTQKSIADLAAELKEPMEVYRTTKYGARAAAMLVALVRWAIPLGVGLLIGYNALQAKMASDLQAQRPATTNAAGKGGDQ